MAESPVGPRLIIKTFRADAEVAQISLSALLRTYCCLDVEDMDPTDMIPMLEALDDNMDDVEEALSPLLKAALSDTAGRLPVLDKAQLYVLVTYAMESILFCGYPSDLD